jgi:hypothetical protein
MTLSKLNDDISKEIAGVRLGFISLQAAAEWRQRLENPAQWQIIRIVKDAGYPDRGQIGFILQEVKSNVNS